MVDTTDLKSVALISVPVRVRPGPPLEITHAQCLCYFFNYQIIMSEETDSTTKVPEVEAIFNQLNAVDFTLAQLAIDLKDPDKRQEIGIRLIENINDAFTKGLEFSDIKVKSKAGVATVSFKFPVAALAKK